MRTPSHHTTDADLQEFAARGFREDIREITHREFDAIDAKEGRAVKRGEAHGQTTAEDRDPRSKWISPWETPRPSDANFSTPAWKARS